MEDNPDCDFYGERQTAIHILNECPVHVGHRKAILGRPLVNINEITE